MNPAIPGTVKDRTGSAGIMRRAMADIRRRYAGLQAEAPEQLRTRRTLARQVNFLWPDGSLLDAQDEAGLGDHMILTPTGSLDLQYMFLNRGGFDNSKWKASSAGLGIAVLLNP